MGFTAGLPVPGSPAFNTYTGPQPPLQSGVTRVPITFQGTPTPGEPISVTVGTDVTSVQPDTLTHVVTNTDTLTSIATAMAALIEAAITAGGNAWATDFTSCSATGAVVYAILGAEDPTNVTIAVTIVPNSQLVVLPIHYPEKISTATTEVTGLKTFAYNTPSGAIRIYKGQRIQVSNDVAQDMINQGLAE